MGTDSNLSSAFVEASFVRSSGIISWDISWFGAGFFSHVDTVLPDWYCDEHRLHRGSLLGARSDNCVADEGVPEPYCAVNNIPFDSTFIPPGVRVRWPDYDKWTSRLVLRIPCTSKQAEADTDYGTSQIGKPYETIGLLKSFSGLFDWHPRDWRAPDAWWCSELRMRQWEVAEIFKVSIPFWSITPGDCVLTAEGHPQVQTVLSYGVPDLENTIVSPSNRR